MTQNKDVVCCLARWSAQHHQDITGTAGENPLECNMIFFGSNVKTKLWALSCKGKISAWAICWGAKLTWRQDRQDLYLKLQKDFKVGFTARPWRRHPHRWCSRLKCESQNCHAVAEKQFLFTVWGVEGGHISQTLSGVQGYSVIVPWENDYRKPHLRSWKDQRSCISHWETRAIVNTFYNSYTTSSTCKKCL